MNKLFKNEHFQEIKEIPGHKNYGCDKLGNVYSKKIQGSEKIGNNWNPLKLCKTAKYLNVAIYRDGENKAHTVRVHRLILETFVGPCPKGMEACHNNGKCDDNRLENLRWDTDKNNNADKRKHGTYYRGSQILWAKLNEDKVKIIKNDLLLGKTPRYLAEKFNVSRANIYQILKRKSWQHVAID